MFPLLLTVLSRYGNRGYEGLGLLGLLREVSARNMVPYLPQRVLMYGAFICRGYIRGVEGVPF